MAFGLNFNIKSVFDQEGFEEADKAMDNLDAASEQLGMSTDELQDRMDALGMSVGKNQQFYKDGQEGSMSFKDGLEELGSEHAAVAAAADEMGESMEFVEEQLARTNMVMHENEEGAQQFRDMTTGAFVEAEDASSEMADQLQTFRFDMLSVMFAGMALGRAMDDLTNPAMEAAGIFDVIGNTLEIFFLPAALMVLDVVLWLREQFLSLPTPVKKFVGVLAILISFLAKVAAAIGVIILNKSAILGFLGAVKVGFLSLGGVIGSIVGVISLPIIIIGAVIAAIAALAYAWHKNLFGIRQKVGKFVKWFGNNFPKIVKAVNPVLGTMDLLIKAVNRLFGKDIDTLGDKFRDIGDGIADMGDEMIKNGNRMDEMKDKVPDAENQGFTDKYMPDVGKNSSTRPMGSDTSEGDTNNEYKNNIYVYGKNGQNEEKIAEEVDKRFRETSNNKTRNV